MADSGTTKHPCLSWEWNGGPINALGHSNSSLYSFIRNASSSSYRALRPPTSFSPHSCLDSVLHCSVLALVPTSSSLAKRVGECVTDVENSGTAEFSIVNVPKTVFENSEFSVIPKVTVTVEVPKTAPVIVHPVVAALKTSTSVQPTTFVLKRKSWTSPGSSSLAASTVTAPIAQLSHFAMVAVKSSGVLVQPTVAIHSRRKWTAPGPSPLANSFSIDPQQTSSLFAVTSTTIFVSAPAIIIHSPRPVHAYKSNLVSAFIASLLAEVPPPVYVPNFEEADRQRDKFLALYVKAVQLGIITDCSNKPLAGMKGTWKDEPFAKRARPTEIKATGSRAVPSFDKENAHTPAAPLAKPKRASGQVW
ncbi:hypothetical protein C8F01DRAFT_486851 [Mycena amicta]|nr:hypothetical protein C8F01DRAFT_486851 [Mycena amicta]